MNTVRGPVAVRWEKKDGKFTLDVTVPPNTRASVQLPVDSAAGVTSCRSCLLSPSNAVEASRHAIIRYKHSSDIVSHNA
jgi:hypothetical protein